MQNSLVDLPAWRQFTVPRLVGLAAATAWFTARGGAASACALVVAHVGSNLADPLTNATVRLCVLTWQLGRSIFHSPQHFATQTAFVFCDAVALAMMGGALNEVILLHVVKNSRLRPMVMTLHAALAVLQWPPRLLTVAASMAELLLVLDLAVARVFHTADSYGSAYQAGRADHPDGVLAILVHGLDLDGSSVSLLAHVLMLHGIPTAACNYHNDRATGFMHAAGDSVEAYTSTCLSQVELLLLPPEAKPGLPKRRRIVLVGHSMGGLVACRMAKALTACSSPTSAVDVAGVLTICAPLGGIPLLTWLGQHLMLRNFLQNVRRFSWWDPRRLVGEFVRVERWIWDEMGARERLGWVDTGGCPLAAAAAGQDALVPAASALAGATTKLVFPWALHNSLLCSRQACDRLARQVVAFTLPPEGHPNVVAFTPPPEGHPPSS